MAQEKAMPSEETLDPEDWASMQVLGHRMVDDVLEYIKTVRERPVWQHASEQVKSHFNKPLPLDPQPPEEIYEEFRESVLPYPIGNIHPRFWGWVLGTGTVLGALAELLAASMNTNTGGGDHHSANHVEKQVIDWLKEMLGFPASASGLLTSGCSAANLIGLAVARNTKAGFDLRREGIQATSHKMVLYASQEIHSSVQKAVELLGLGSDALRLVSVNDYLQIDLEVLKATIAQDRKHGHLPFCVVGTAGTTNTGAVDDLDALADICQRENLWFHVDGAFGAWAALAPEARNLITGMERADSLAFDLHKWMYMPYEIGGVLVRREQDHRSAFSLTPVYLAHGEGGRGLMGGDLPWFSDYGFQLSRGFRALKAWMSLKEHGSRKYGRLIQQNINQARYLAELVDAAPELELSAPVTLNVVCFRYIGFGLDDSALDALNKQILVELQEQGIAAPSGTIVRGKYVLHVAHTNHRSRREDFDVLVRAVIRIGQELVQSARNTKYQNDAAANPWLTIPWEDYEGHMSSPAVKQLQFLSALFRGVLEDYRPGSVAVPGCATGNGFEHIDPAVTQRVTGVDISPHYLEVLRTRFGSTITDLQLVCADLATCELERTSFDLVYCALVLEYVEPGALIEKVARWLRPHGVLVVVLQLPSVESKVSETEYESLRRLEPTMRLVEPEELQRAVAKAGLSEVRGSKETLKSGKEFFVGHYRKGSPAPDASQETDH